MLSLICTVLFVGSQVAVSGQGSFRLTPEEVARRVTQQITFSGALSAWPETRRAEYLRQFEIEAHAMKLIPDGVEAASPAIARSATVAAGVALEFDDVELNRLTIEKALMDHLLLLEQARLLPSLDQDAAESLKADVLHAMDSANAIIKKHLADVLPGELIDRMTQRLSESMVRMISDPTTYWMKQRPDTEGLHQLLQVFEERLAMSRDRAVTRLDLVNTSMKTAPAPEDEALRAARRDREMQDILDEVLSPLRKGLLTATSPPQLLELNNDPDRIVPGYSATVRQWSKRYREVARQASESARQEREHERRAREARFAATSMAHAALAEVVDGAVVTPDEVAPDEDARIEDAHEEDPPSKEPSRESKGMSLPVVMGIGICAIVVTFLYSRWRHIKMKNHRMRHAPENI